jgi:hypothetical protein
MGKLKYIVDNNWLLLIKSLYYIEKYMNKTKLNRKISPYIISVYLDKNLQISMSNVISLIENYSKLIPKKWSELILRPFIKIVSWLF